MRRERSADEGHRLFSDSEDQTAPENSADRGDAALLQPLGAISTQCSRNGVAATPSSKRLEAKWDR